MKKLARFFVNVKKEMKKVRWPKKKEMIKFSVATIAVLCFFMLFFIGIDALLGMIVKVFG